MGVMTYVTQNQTFCHYFEIHKNKNKSANNEEGILHVLPTLFKISTSHMFKISAIQIDQDIHNLHWTKISTKSTLV